MLNLPENHENYGFDTTYFQTVQCSRDTLKSLFVTIAGNLPHYMKFRYMRRQTFIVQVVLLCHNLPHFYKLGSCDPQVYKHSCNTPETLSTIQWNFSV